MMWMYLGLFLIGGAAAHVSVPGDCPKVKTMENFDLTKSVGKWYEAESYFPDPPIDEKCVTVTYTVNKNGALSVVYKQISSSNGEELSVSGTVSQDNAEKAKFTHVFPSNPAQFTTTYWIVYTDYKSYAVVWSCSGKDNNSAGIVQIFTRAQEPEAAVLVKAHQVLDQNKISRAFLVQVDQKNCPKKTESNQVA